MNSTQIQPNKEFILEYFEALSEKDKTPALCEIFISDQALLEHTYFFESGFPKYEIYADEITAEGNQVIVKSTYRATHSKEWNGMKASHKTAEFPFVVSYTIEDGMITDHWILIDQMSMTKQLQS